MEVVRKTISINDDIWRETKAKAHDDGCYIAGYVESALRAFNDLSSAKRSRCCRNVLYIHPAHQTIYGQI